MTFRTVPLQPPLAGFLKAAEMGGMIHTRIGMENASHFTAEDQMEDQMSDDPGLRSVEF